MIKSVLSVVSVLCDTTPDAALRGTGLGDEVVKGNGSSQAIHPETRIRYFLKRSIRASDSSALKPGNI